MSVSKSYIFQFNKERNRVLELIHGHVQKLAHSQLLHRCIKTSELCDNFLHAIQHNLSIKVHP